MSSTIEFCFADTGPLRYRRDKRLQAWLMGLTVWGGMLPPLGSQELSVGPHLTLREADPLKGTPKCR